MYKTNKKTKKQQQNKKKNKKKTTKHVSFRLNAFVRHKNKNNKSNKDILIHKLEIQTIKIKF